MNVSEGALAWAAAYPRPQDRDRRAKKIRLRKTGGGAEDIWE